MKPTKKPSKQKSTKHVTPAVAQADAQSDAGERMAAKVLANHKPSPAKERNHEEELRYRAQRWAELHANPKDRAKMDTQLLNLSEEDQRVVYLNGQRIRAGMPYKTFKPSPEQPTRKGATNGNHNRAKGKAKA